MSYQLTAQTILDDRYRILEPLGQGGFGITYLAENIRLGMQVAIKELFWRDHCVRSTDEPSRVILRDPRDGPQFAAQMERFLREARILRDFSDLPGVVRIQDYFEANATAYIVMELIDGRTLSNAVEQDGPFPEEKALRAMLPLARSLSRIHAGGLIHRDIGPDNIMIRKDGSLTLIDFGSARPVTQEKTHTAMGTDHFAAPEQYDQKGKQGPWTDVYGLCATLYYCITGVRPDTAVQRLFLDELRAPSGFNPDLMRGTDALILKGLSMDQSMRYPDMNALANAMEKLLPDPLPKPFPRFWILVIAALLLVITALGVWQYAHWRHENRLYGVETMRFLLTPGNSLSARAYAGYQEKLNARLSTLAGPDRYLIRQDGASLEVTLPVSVFGDRRADEVLTGVLFQETDSEEERAIRLKAEILVSWEDPGTSLLAGEHQVSPSAFSDATILLVYEPERTLTLGERANMIADLKVRLDALDTPYAFGLQRGSSDRCVIRLSPSHIGLAVLDTLGSGRVELGSPMSDTPRVPYHHAYTWGSRSLEILTTDGGRALLCKSQHELEDLSELFLRYGEDHLYLMTENGLAFLEGSLTEPIRDGQILLTHLRFTDAAGMDVQADYMFDYLDALVNQSSLPCTCFLRAQQLVDADGRTLLGKNVSSLYGLECPRTPSEASLHHDLSAFCEKAGLDMFYDAASRHYWLYANYPIDADLPEKSMDLLRQLLETGIFRTPRSAEWIFLVPAEEEGNRKCRFIFYPDYDRDAKELFTDLDFYAYAPDGPSSYASYAYALREALSAFDLKDSGCRKSVWLNAGQ